MYCDTRGLDLTNRVNKDQRRQPQFVDSEGLGVVTTDPSLTKNLSQKFKKSNENLSQKFKKSSVDQAS